jgi:hypothetical protein
MGYCTVADVKALAGATLTTDDALIATLVTRATQIVDTYTRRVFAVTTETRYFTPGVDTQGATLHLDTPLVSATEVINGDDEIVDPADYVLLPLNESPKTRLRLKASSGVYWTYEEDPEGAISVEGEWGYASAPPADVVQATARLALWLYRQRESPFNRMGNQITGEYEVPTALPDDVARLLDPYRLHTWGAA